MIGGIQANNVTALAIPIQKIAFRTLSNSVNLETSMFNAQCVVNASPAHEEKYPINNIIVIDINCTT